MITYKNERIIHTVVGVVTNADGVSLILELGDSNDRTEDFLLGDLHVRGDIGEDGGLDEVALGTVAVTTKSDGGTLLLSVVDVLHNTVELELGDLGTLEGVTLEGVAELVLSGTLLEASDELVVNALLDQQARTGAAALAVVEEDTEVSPGDSVVDIGVLEDNVGGLATELKSNLLQVRLGSGLQDHTANESGTSEGDLVDVHVAGDGGTGDTAETGDDVNDTGREASLDNKLGGVKTRERGLFGGLNDDGVTSGNGRTNLPSPHQNGEVPGDDLTADTDGLVAGVGESLGVGVNSLTSDLISPATVVAETAGSVGNVDLGHSDGLSVIKSLNGSDGVHITLEEVGELGEHTATFGGNHLLPGTLEGLASCLHSNVDILLGSLVDGGNGLLVGGVQGFEGLAINTLNKFVVNEPWG